MVRRYSKKKGPVRSKKVEYDGIKFQSGLEKHMYIALRKAKIKSQYEGQTYELVPSFNFEQEAYERQGNGKGEYRNRGNKKILNIKYTPDFVGNNFIIECKGRPNESFPIRWKLFKAYVHKHLPTCLLYTSPSPRDRQKSRMPSSA